MSVMIKCKMCGGDLMLTEGSAIATCEYCGTTQTVPSHDNEKKLNLFARADRLRRNCEFDKAAGVYETIVADFPEEAEAYWGLVLCKYGIEYVDDPVTSKKIPTCHRSSFESLLDDGNFEQTLENADPVCRKLYREEAKSIERIRKGIIEVSSKEDPYDIFICYKETDEIGERTQDSVLAQNIYDSLTDKGYRVFFSRITLEDKLGVAYEPYIFAALNSAKVMLAVGTAYAYYNAVWVKNEWSRYLKLCALDKTKHLIPCFKGIDAYDMPREFRHLQGVDLGKMGAMQDLLRGIDKLIAPEKPIIQAAPQVYAEDLNRSFIYNSALEKGEEDKIASVEAAIDKLKTISGYADTDQQIIRLEKKRKELKSNRRIKRLLIWGAVVFVIIWLAGHVRVDWDRLVRIESNSSSTSPETTAPMEITPPMPTEPAFAVPEATEGASQMLDRLIPEGDFAVYCSENHRIQDGRFMWILTIKRTADREGQWVISHYDIVNNGAWMAGSVYFDDQYNKFVFLTDNQMYRFDGFVENGNLTIENGGGVSFSGLTEDSLDENGTYQLIESDWDPTEYLNRYAMRCIVLEDRAMAEHILESWWSGGATEEVMIQWMNTYAPEQGGGQLYLVNPGEMVAQIDEWLFGMEHKHGDTAILETEYGYALCYVSYPPRNEK